MADENENRDVLNWSSEVQESFDKAMSVLNDRSSMQVEQPPLPPSEIPIVRPYGLGRMRSVDTRDRRFLMSRVLPVRAPRPRTLPYRLGATLDQGSSSQCVGYSNRHKLAAAPIMVTTGRGLSAFEIYHGAQMNDEWPGESYDGTSVRGAFKFLSSLGYLKSYVWAQSVEECHKFLHDGWGTIVVGTDWYDAMFDPNAKGFVRPTGAMAGGHAYHLFWSVALDSTSHRVTDLALADPTHSEVWFQNSWGTNWGIRLNGQYGCFKMTWADFQKLIDDYGEAGAGIEVKVA